MDSTEIITRLLLLAQRLVIHGVRPENKEEIEELLEQLDAKL